MKEPSQKELSTNPTAPGREAEEAGGTATAPAAPAMRPAEEAVGAVAVDSGIPELHEVGCPDELRERIEELMGRYPDRRSASIPALWAVQRRYGWCTPEGIRQAAAVMRVTPAYLESVASFYDLLRTSPSGRNEVLVCTNISCWMRGGDELLDALCEAAGTAPGQSTDDGEVFVSGFECLGACDIAPMAAVNERYYGPLEPDDSEDMIGQLRAGSDVAPAKALLSRPTAGGADGAPLETRVLFKGIDEPGLAGIDTYRDRDGYRALEKAFGAGDPDELLAELEASGLRGRGGAGFSMGKKASFLPRGSMDKYLCCNADESEPGAFKDRELMQKNPHQLIEGIAIAALAAGANRAFIFIRGEYDAQADILDRAVAEAYEAGFLGESVCGSEHQVELVVHRGAGAYICGEETALLDALEGKRGNPRLKPPFPAVQGLYGGPTLINNVETLSNVPHIVANGAEWFKSMGTEQSPGTKVVSVSGCVERPGNYEVELGISARRIIYELAGGPLGGRQIKAWFPGGSSAPVLTDVEIDLPYSFESMAEAGSMLGSGSIIIADETVSIPHLALRTARFYHHESCGKCTPCREGTNWTVKMLERVIRGDATPMDLDIITSVQQNIIGNCLCVLGDSMAMPVGAMVRKFRGEFERAIELGREAQVPGLDDSPVLPLEGVGA
ncbi:MAG: NADH-quinone oxidoreductase subunit [Solirubrobacterales bacterium]|nr:NADH-quinone oxidoreductase subunit [Solirubrobacterales bacterium]